MSATGQPERAASFAPVVPGFRYVPFNDCEALEAALDAETVALLLEVVQGESGVWPATQQYLDTAARLCKEREILLILDEVQTGIYRTGTPFAFHQYGIEPDIITSAKGLGNGFPLGALIARSEVAAAFEPGDHGTTFGGGPIACAAALATLRAFDGLRIDGRSIGAHVRATGEYVKGQLARSGFFTDVRGKGLMIGATLSEPSPLSATQLRDALCKAGFIINSIGERYIRLLPPLVCKNMHVEALIAAIYAIMRGKGKETS
jgi:acetylornithine/succinyldiaminopimelate/putrescine aminotransferase